MRSSVLLGRCVTSYDEVVTSATDPQQVEPPPTVSLVSRIFLLSDRHRTVVNAPLREIEAVATDGEARGPVSPPPRADETSAPLVTPVRDRLFAELVSAASVEQVSQTPVATPPVVVSIPAPPAAELRSDAIPTVRRHCRRCRGEVVVTLGARKCPEGHRLRAAHARRSRR